MSKLQSVLGKMLPVAALSIVTALVGGIAFGVGYRAEKQQTA